MQNCYEAVLAHVRAGEACVMLTSLAFGNGRPAGVVRKKEVMTLAQLKGDPPEPEIAKAVAQALDTGGIQQLKTRDGRLVIEPFTPRPRLLVFGGGHVALPLCEFADRIGFSTVVMDDRPFFASRSRFPKAENVVCASFEDCLDLLKPCCRDYAVIVTRGHRHDGIVLRQLLGKGLAYLGMIGSKRRIAGMWRELEQEGFSRRQLEEVHAPIGLGINAATPEEIAVSILAELIACKNGSGKKEAYSDMDLRVLSEAAKKQALPVALLTILSSRGSVPRRAGAKMLVFYDGATVGSIGGGCSEAGVLRRARELMGSPGCQLEAVDMTGEAAEDEGMVCGGTMEVLIEVPG